MKRTGVFITFAMFFLIMSVLALNTAMQRTSEVQQTVRAESSAFASVNNRFYNIYSETFILKEGYAGRTQARILPFLDFKSGPNWIEFTETIPKDPVDFSDTYDAMNLFEVFIEEESIRQDLDIDLDAIKNGAWGGTTNDLGYLILPQCVLYKQDVDEGDVMVLEDGFLGGGCGNPFDLLSIDKIEVTLVIGDTDNILPSDPILCTVPASNYFNDGGQDCKNTEYEGGHSEPWGFLRFMCDPVTDPNCTEANFPGYEVAQTSAFYWDDESSNQVMVNYLTGGPIYVTFTSARQDPKRILHIENGRVVIEVVVRITFRDDITTKFNAFNYIVISKPNFGIERSYGDVPP